MLLKKELARLLIYDVSHQQIEAMEPKEKNKKWESGPMQDTDDKRTKEQLERAKEEVERQKENLDDHGEGSYSEKNGDEDDSFEDLKGEPKMDVKPTHPATDK